MVDYYLQPDAHRINSDIVAGEMEQESKYKLKRRGRPEKMAVNVQTPGLFQDGMKRHSTVCRLANRRRSVPRSSTLHTSRNDTAFNVCV